MNRSGARRCDGGTQACTSNKGRNGLVVINQTTILGPPGTGKTTRLLEIVVAELDGGLRPDELAFVTFTKAARIEALDRLILKFGFHSNQLPWVRTVHSACFRLLGLNSSQVMKGPQWRKFADYHLYELTTEKKDPDPNIEDPIIEPVKNKKHDYIRNLIEWAALRCLSLEDAYQKYPDKDRVDVGETIQFHHHLIEYKKKFGLYTFCDMIEQAVNNKLYPHSVRVLIVDEAQDLSPLLIRAVEMWRTHVGYTYLAGDDDQAIYAFQGADPKWLGEQFRASGKHEILSKSWRVPASVHAVALSIIASNRDRVPKEYEPREEPGMVTATSTMQAFQSVPVKGSVFVLARNRRLLADWRDILRDAGEIYEGSPLSRPTIRAALNAAKRLHSTGGITRDELLSILKFVPTGPLAPRGVKTKIKKLDYDIHISQEDICCVWNMPDIVDMADNPASLLLKDIDEEELDYIRSALETHEGDIPEPRWILSTIHSAKGREAHTVVLLSDMLKASHRELQGEYGQDGIESEHRVAYVGVTRAKKSLIIVLPVSDYFFDYEDHIG